MKKKTITTLPNPQSGLPHQIDVADEAALPQAIRQAVLTGLRHLPASSRPAVVRILQEEGYRGHTLYRLVKGNEDGIPLCVVGPLVQHAESGSLKQRPDTIDVRYGAYAEEFFAGFFQKSPTHRKLTVYEEFRLPKPEKAELLPE